MRNICSLLLVLLLFLPAAASNVEEIIVVGPAWEGFTNKDGTGLYHDLLGAIGDQLGIKITRYYVPSDLAYEMVRQGRADLMTCHDVPLQGLILGKSAMYESEFHALFRKDVTSEWKGQQSLAGKVTAWRKGYYSRDNFDVEVEPLEVIGGVSALGMVVFERADFYIEDINLMYESMGKADFDFDPESIRIEPVGRRSYRPLFAPNERGREVMALYEQGMEELYRQGILRDIFSKWGHEMPDYTFAKEVSQ